MDSNYLIYVALVSICAFTLKLPAVFGENAQSWSHHAYKDEPYDLACENDDISLSPGNSLTWTRDGPANSPLAPDSHFEMIDLNGVPNGILRVKKVTDETKGIYICHVMNSSTEYLGAVVVGLNIGGHKYHDDIDKYGDKMIVGAIAGASVFFVVVAAGLISHMRYLPEESLEKRRQRKKARLEREKNGVGLPNASYVNGDNEAMAGSQM